MRQPYCPGSPPAMTMLLCATLLFSQSAFSQTTPPVPANAEANRYGSAGSAIVDSEGRAIPALR